MQENSPEELIQHAGERREARGSNPCPFNSPAYKEKQLSGIVEPANVHSSRKASNICTVCV